MIAVLPELSDLETDDFFPETKKTDIKFSYF